MSFLKVVNLALNVLSHSLANASSQVRLIPQRRHPIQPVNLDAWRRAKSALEDAVSATVVSHASFKGSAGEMMVRSVLAGGGLHQVNDVYLPSREGYTQVDHVALAGGCLVVIETKNYEGWIFGREMDATWTVSLAGGRSRHSFQNPIRQNYGHVKAVREATQGGVPVVGLVVFVGGATFPKGLPAGVTTLGQMPAALASIAREHPSTPHTLSRWHGFVHAVSAIDRAAAKAAHKEALRRCGGRH